MRQDKALVCELCFGLLEIDRENVFEKLSLGEVHTRILELVVYIATGNTCCVARSARDKPQVLIRAISRRWESLPRSHKQHYSSFNGWLMLQRS